MVGTGRLPNFDDRGDLPYVNAAISELIRWGTPGLMSMTRDLSVYPDPSLFDPARFIETSGKEVQYDPRKIIFGFARRTCPGNVLAESIIYSASVHCLATLDIQKALNKATGEPVVPVYEYSTDHIVRCVVSFLHLFAHLKKYRFLKFFDCSIKPRPQIRLL